MLEMSIRSAMFALIIALPYIAPELYSFFSYTKCGPGGIIVFIMFNFAPILAGTLVGVMNALLVFTQDDCAWHFGLICLVATVCFMLAASFPDGVKVCSSIIAGAFGVMFMVCISATVAIFLICIPYLSMKARKGMCSPQTRRRKTRWRKGEGLITAMLRTGANALGASVGNLWHDHYYRSTYTRHLLLSCRDVVLKLVYLMPCIQKTKGGKLCAQPASKENVEEMAGKIRNTFDTGVYVIGCKTSHKDIKFDQFEVRENDRVRE
ncbi:hypothetical protein N9L19_00045 [bacterium]|nr:hypothetical protein [bacterium]